jgi:general secretion pathway protein G
MVVGPMDSAARSAPAPSSGGASSLASSFPMLWMFFPAFDPEPSVNARTNSMTSSLQTVRSQLELYKVQHNDNYPKLAEFVRQMTAKTDMAGWPGAEFGEYLHDIPPNPFTEDATVGGGPVGSSAWFYNEKTGEFRANDTAAHAAY